MLIYVIAVGESAPGPIMVNLAAYVGSSQAGIPGLLVAAFAVVLPSFIIILLVTVLLTAVLKNPCVLKVKIRYIGRCRQLPDWRSLNNTSLHSASGTSLSH